MPIDKDGYYHTEHVRAAVVGPKIDTGIPMPEPRAPRNDKGYIKALRTLQVGESVFLPTSYGSIYGMVNVVRTEHQSARAPIPLFVLRAESDADGRQGYRVWRSA